MKQSRTTLKGHRSGAIEARLKRFEDNEAEVLTLLREAGVDIAATGYDVVAALKSFLEKGGPNGHSG